MSCLFGYHVNRTQHALGDEAYLEQLRSNHPVADAELANAGDLADEDLSSLLKTTTDPRFGR